ncbi:MAG: hypothetical protein ACI8ZO_001621 [Flavobacteriales bacterium]|jgi:hypothetical protein
MKHILLSLILGFTIFLTNQGQSQNSQTPDSNCDYGKISESFVRNLMEGKEVSEQIEIFADATVNDLARQLKTDMQKRAFWMNVYNGYIQYYLNKNPGLYKNRGAFFGTERMVIAGRIMSFDDIEHGIIRGSRVKITLGYTKKMFVSSYERRLRVGGKDGRIHFSLNCGAKSCPPVAIFRAEDVDRQMDILSQNYLNVFANYSKKENKVYTPALMSWFRADFGGIKGVKKFLKQYSIVPKDSGPEIEFTKYDWTLYLGNYSDI